MQSGAPGDYDSVWRYLRSDNAVRLFEPCTRERLDVSDDYFGPFEMPEYGFGEATLFTADLVNGRSACWLSDKDIEYVPHASIDQLAAIAQRMTGNELELFATWPHVGGGDDYDDWPGGGVHLDFRTKTVWGWDAWGLDWRETFPDLWPGWRFVELGDCWEVQEGRTRGRTIRQPLREVMLETLGFWPDGSPMPGPVGDPYHPHTRRDALIRELLASNPRLAPSAFLQADGRICWEPRALCLA